MVTKIHIVLVLGIQKIHYYFPLVRPKKVFNMSLVTDNNFQMRARFHFLVRQFIALSGVAYDRLPH